MDRSARCSVVLGSLAFTAAAPGAFLSVLEATVEGTTAQGDRIYRVWALSNDPADHVLAVNGDANVASLELQSFAGPLVNTPDGYGIFTAATDRMRASPFHQANDSYFALGADPAVGNVQFSPEFLGGYTSQYSPAMVVGSSFSQADNGGYFDSNPTSAVNPDADLRVLLAQFVLPDESPFGDDITPFTFTGTLSYNDGATGELESVSLKTSQFLTQAPGALGLFAWVGMRPRRRREAIRS